MEKYQLVLDEIDPVMDIVVQRAKLKAKDFEGLKDIAREHLARVENPKQWQWYIEVFNEGRKVWKLFYQEKEKSKEGLALERGISCYYSITDVARILGLTEIKVRQKIGNQEIVAQKLGKSWRISQEEVYRLLQEIGAKRAVFEEALGICSSIQLTKEAVTSRLQHYIQVALLAMTQADLKGVLVTLENELKYLIDEMEEVKNE